MDKNTENMLQVMGMQRNQALDTVVMLQARVIELEAQVKALTPPAETPVA